MTGRTYGGRFAILGFVGSLGCMDFINKIRGRKSSKSEESGKTSSASGKEGGVHAPTIGGVVNKAAGVGGAKGGAAGSVKGTLLMERDVAAPDPRQRLKALLGLTSDGSASRVSVSKAAKDFFREFEELLYREQLVRKTDRWHSLNIPTHFKDELHLLFQAIRSTNISTESRIILEEQLFGFLETLMQSKDTDSLFLANLILEDLGRIAPKDSEPSKHYQNFNQHDIALYLQALALKLSAGKEAIEIKARVLSEQAASTGPLTAEQTAAIRSEAASKAFEERKAMFRSELGKIPEADLVKDSATKSIRVLDGINKVLGELRAYVSASNDASLRKEYDGYVAEYVRALMRNANEHGDLNYRYDVYNEVIKHFVGLREISVAGGEPPSVQNEVRAFARSIADAFIELPGADNLINAKSLYRVLGLEENVGALDFREIQEALRRGSPRMSVIGPKIRALAENTVWLEQTDGVMSNKDKFEAYFLAAVEFQLRAMCQSMSFKAEDSELMNIYKQLYGNSSIEIRSLYHRLLAHFASEESLSATKNLLSWIAEKDPQSNDAALQFNAINIWMGVKKSLKDHPAVKQLNVRDIAMRMELRGLHNILASALSRLTEAEVPTVRSLVELLYGRGVINPTLIADLNGDAAKDAVEYFRLCIDALTRPEIFLTRNDVDSLLNDAFMDDLLKNAERITDPKLRMKISEILLQYGKRLVENHKLIAAHAKDVEEQQSTYLGKVANASKKQEASVLSRTILGDASRFLLFAARLGNTDALKELQRSKDPVVKAMVKKQMSDIRLSQKEVKAVRAAERKAQKADANVTNPGTSLFSRLGAWWRRSIR